jgi:hypothetical protein
VIELAVSAAAKSTSAWDQPGTLGFLVVFGLAVILFFVFRSLNKHLRKINEAARQEALLADAAAAGTVTPGSAGAVREPGNPLAQSDYERQQSEANAAMIDFEL